MAFTRELVFDTETTGFDPAKGDRIVEIGMIELCNHIANGQQFHEYIDPERDMPQSAYEVHGLSSEFLTGKPTFADIAEKLLDFIGDDSLLIAHNATFDMKFVNYELTQLGYDPISEERVLDTLQLARRKHPAGPNSLDALCARYHIDNSARTKHGALLDSEILAEVYIELIGGKQADFGLSNRQSGSDGSGGRQKKPQQRPRPLPPRLSQEDKQAHAAFVETLGDKAIWKDYQQ